MADRAFGDRLVNAIYSTGRTQRGFAREIGIGISSLTRYINGQRYPDSATIENMAQALGVTASYLKGS